MRAASARGGPPAVPPELALLMGAPPDDPRRARPLSSLPGRMQLPVAGAAVVALVAFARLTRADEGGLVTFLGASAVGVAFALDAPRRRQVAVLALVAGATVAWRLRIGTAPGPALAFAAANVIEAVTALVVVHRSAPFGLTLDRRRAVVRFVGAAAAGGLAGGAVLVAGRALTGDAPLGAGDTFLVRSLAGLIGLLTVAPPLMVAGRLGELGRRGWVELVAVGAVLLVATDLAFTTGGVRDLVLPYVPLGVLLLAAVRIRVPGIAVLPLVLVPVALAHSVAGHGSFAVLVTDPVARIVTAQLFAVVALLAAWLVAATATEREDAVAELAEGQLRLLFDQAPAPIAVAGTDGRIVRVNHAMAELLGGAPGDILGRPMDDFVHPDDRPDAAELGRALAAGEVDDRMAQRRYVRLDGTVGWGMVAVTLLRDRQQRPAGIAVRIQDVTEQQRWRELVDAIFESTADLLVVYDLRNGTTRFSPSWATLGWDPDELAAVGRLGPVLHPDDRAGLEDRFTDLAAVGFPATAESRVGTRGGEWRWVRFQVTQLPDRDVLVAMGTDVTEARAAAERVREDADRAEALAACSGALQRAEGPLEDLLHDALVPVARLMAATSIVLLPDGPVFRSVTVANRDAAVEGLARRLNGADPFPVGSEGVLGHVLHTGTPVVMRRVEPGELEAAWPRYAEFFAAARPSAAVVLPLRVAERVIGVFVAFPTGTTAPLDDGVVAFLTDVADRCAAAIDSRRLHAELRDNERRFRSLFEGAPVASVVMSLLPESAGRFLMANPAYEALTGYREDELLGRRIVDVTHPDDRAEDERIIAGLVTGELGPVVQHDKRYVRADGSVIWVNAQLSVLEREGRPVHTITHVIDITDRRRADEELARRALYDPLTGLANRHRLLDRLTLALEQRRRGQGDVAVVYLDLNRFKDVNDSYGHEAGDQVLIEVGRRLGDAVRQVDTAARLAGDEFVVVCPGVAPGAAGRIAERVQRALAPPVAVGRSVVDLGASIGVAVTQPGDVTVDDLLHQADTAMYAVKHAGGEGWALFDESMRREERRRLDVEGELRRAVALEQLALHFQPVVDLRRGAVVGVEALLRLADGEGGLRPASDFIDVAEESEVMPDICRWVFERAFAHAAAWRARFGPLEVAVNVSARQLADRTWLRDTVEAAAGAAGLPLDAAVLELTEDALGGGGPGVGGLVELAAAGVHVAVDDFGSGSSSIVALKRFPVDTLKIGRSFLSGLGTAAADETMVEALAALAHRLGLRVVAAGVEREEQLEVLRRLDGMWAQGYAVGPPMPADELTAVLARSGAGRDGHGTSHPPALAGGSDTRSDRFR